VTELPGERASVTTLDNGIARVAWDVDLQNDGLMAAVGVVHAAVEAALADHHRVEALVPVDDETAQRIATWSGLRREGIMRAGHEGEDRVVYARLVTDPPASEPDGFRALLNSFLPRKRAIGQVLIRDEHGRVLLCQLTYKKDWDLPGGVVEVGESPELAAVREVKEELGLDVVSNGLLVTDWLPPWGGWDDALCLVFDGGEQRSDVEIVRQEREIHGAEFCTLDKVHERAADFTARRIEAALRQVGRAGGYTESGR
jgi:8-oxo-dGTP pyrophosphatase MutT (NUDIX family)